MPTSYGALCSDFYVNLRLGVKMDLPTGRETILDLFDRIRREAPQMQRFRRYDDELSLESPHHEDGRHQWVSLRRTSIRAGVVNPETLEDAYKLHELILDVAPFFLSISPLDIESVEASFGFDLEAQGNHNAIVHDALYAGSPLSGLVDADCSTPIDMQPSLGFALTRRCDVQAHIEIKTRTSTKEIRTKRFREEPISVYLTARRYGPVADVKQTTSHFREMSEHVERLAEERLIPHVITPLREAIASEQF